jgi:hypothetical protein
MPPRIKPTEIGGQLVNEERFLATPPCGRLGMRIAIRT